MCLYVCVAFMLHNTHIHTNVCVYIYIYIYIYISRVTRRLPFQYLLHRGVGESATPFPDLLHFTLDLYPIMLSGQQGGIKYHFLNLWYDSNWDGNPVSRTIDEHSIHEANMYNAVLPKNFHRAQFPAQSQI